MFSSSAPRIWQSCSETAEIPHRFSPPFRDERGIFRVRAQFCALYTIFQQKIVHGTLHADNPIEYNIIKEDKGVPGKRHLCPDFFTGGIHNGYIADKKRNSGHSL